jgi:hypothetical protein
MNNRKGCWSFAMDDLVDECINVGLEKIVVDFEGVSNLFVVVVLVTFVYNNQCLKPCVCLPLISSIIRNIYCVNSVRVKRTKYANASMPLLAMAPPCIL